MRTMSCSAIGLLILAISRNALAVDVPTPNNSRYVEVQIEAVESQWLERERIWMTAFSFLYNGELAVGTMACDPKYNNGCGFWDAPLLTVAMRTSANRHEKVKLCLHSGFSNSMGQDGLPSMSQNSITATIDGFGYRGSWVVTQYVGPNNNAAFAKSKCYKWLISNSN